MIGGNTPTLDQQIQKLFANGEQGFFYDPNDLSTMFQDAAGTVPVTGAGQPVGLMLDKSKGLIRGQEVNTDPYFTSPANWALLRSSILGGKLMFTDVTTAASAQIKDVTTLGRWYEVTLTVDSLSGILRVSPSYDGDSAQLLSPTNNNARYIYICYLG